MIMGCAHCFCTTVAPRHTEFSLRTWLRTEMKKRDFLVITVRSGRPPSGELTSHCWVPSLGQFVLNQRPFQVLAYRTTGQCPWSFSFLRCYSAILWLLIAAALRILETSLSCLKCTNGPFLKSKVLLVCVYTELFPSVALLELTVRSRLILFPDWRHFLLTSLLLLNLLPQQWQHTQYLP